MAFIEEALRKTIHIGSIAFPIATVFIFYCYPENGKMYMVSGLALLAVLMVIIDLLKTRHRPFKNFFYTLFGKVLRDKEIEGGMTASTVLVAAAAVTIFIFREPVAVSALVFLSLGDSAAALIGKNYGRIKLIGKRTLEGSLASLCTCLIAGLVLLWASPLLGWYLTPIALLAGSIAATLAELFELPLDDNFRIPIIAGVVMELLLPG